MEQKTFKLWKSVELILCKPELVRGCVLGGGIYNTQPRSKYTSSYICLSIVLIFIDFTIAISYDYKKKYAIDLETKTNEDFFAGVKTPIKEGVVGNQNSIEVQKSLLLLRTKTLAVEFSKLDIKKSFVEATGLLTVVSRADSEYQLDRLAKQVLRLETFLPKDSSYRTKDFVEEAKVRKLILRAGNLEKSFIEKKMYNYRTLVNEIKREANRDGLRILERTKYIELLKRLETLEDVLND